MPTYDYRCDACRHTMAVFQSIKDEPLADCPACGEKRLRRLIGSGAGIIFKGSGFYETDYKRSRGANGKPGSPDESRSESKPESKSDSRSESKSDPNSDPKSGSKPDPKPESKASPGAKPATNSDG